MQSCCDDTCDGEIKEVGVVVKLIAHPFQFLLLLFSVVMIPLLLDVLKKFLLIDQEFFSVLLLPYIDLALQTLLQLKHKIVVGRHFIRFSTNSYIT